jgi:type VI secretion system protein ImpC
VTSGGRSNCGICEVGAGLANRSAVALDPDNFDQVLAKLGARIDLPLDNSMLSLRFAELDDFHPDRIFERADISHKLRQMRQRLADPETFAELRREMRPGPATSRAAEAAKPSSQQSPASADLGRLVCGSVLEQTPAETEGRPEGSRPSRASDELRAFVERVVQPHSVAKVSRQAEMTTALDRATGAQMRALLHVPDFQAFKSAWRADGIDDCRLGIDDWTRQEKDRQITQISHTDDKREASCRRPQVSCVICEICGLSSSRPVSG